jgi:hypothetical protein
MIEISDECAIATADGEIIGTARWSLVRSGGR